MRGLTLVASHADNLDILLGNNCEFFFHEPEQGYGVSAWGVPGKACN